MITIRQRGNFKNLDSYFRKSLNIAVDSNRLEEIIKDCIKKLKKATPVDTGLTASSWEYSIKTNRKNVVITISNTNIQNGVNIALILEYGHGTENGAWIEGRNFIQPIVLETYQEILNTTWEEVKRL